MAARVCCSSDCVAHFASRRNTSQRVGLQRCQARAGPQDQIREVQLSSQGAREDIKFTEVRDKRNKKLVVRDIAVIENQLCLQCLCK